MNLPADGADKGESTGEGAGAGVGTTLPGRMGSCCKVLADPAANKGQQVSSPAMPAVGIETDFILFI